MTPLELVREYFPDVDDYRAGYILWNYTGYPGFFTGDPETCLRDQLQHVKDVGFEQMDAELETSMQS